MLNNKPFSRIDGISKVLVVFMWNMRQKMRWILTLFFICFENKFSWRFFLQFYTWTIIVFNTVKRLSYYRKKSITLELKSFLWMPILIFNNFSNLWKLASLLIFCLSKLTKRIGSLKLRISKINKRFFTDIAFMMAIISSLLHISHVLFFEFFRLKLRTLLICSS